MAEYRGARWFVAYRASASASTANVTNNTTFLRAAAAGGCHSLFTYCYQFVVNTTSAFHNVTVSHREIIDH